MTGIETLLKIVCPTQVAAKSDLVRSCYCVQPEVSNL